MNMAEHPLEHYKEYVMPYITSKKEEFELLGYNQVADNQIWDFFIMKRWKKNSENKMLHQVVNDILHLSISDYMNFVQVEAYKAPNRFLNGGMDTLNDLL
jgi:hypothetical protein